MKTVLITGAAGFIGAHLSEYYLKNNFSVIGLDNFCTGSKSNRDFLKNAYPTQFQLVEHDICLAWPEIKSSVDLVFHLASPASVEHYQKLNLETMWSNSIGLHHAIQFADQNKARLIFSSTSEVYGSPLTSPQKESDWGSVNSFGARSCYDEAKRFGEALIYSANERNKTKHGLVRIFNTFGPRMNQNDGRVVLQFIQQALQNKDLTVFGDGKQTRSFCYIDDLMRGLTAYAESDLNIPINLGNDQEITILELAKTIIQIAESKSKITLKPLPSDDPQQRKPDLTLARKYLNYQTKNSLSDGLEKMITSTRQSSSM